jgi:hypothetical protein
VGAAAILPAMEDECMATAASDRSLLRGKLDLSRQKRDDFLDGD